MLILNLDIYFVERKVRMSFDPQSGKDCFEMSLKLKHDFFMMGR
ncbi:hypothetical protein [Paraclostridium bifermentans]|nr:hypothetical protein [Paraclostridium bifermentans]MDU3802359.1 hypothetical protein [Paraclostridium bifermentans]